MMLEGVYLKFSSLSHLGSELMVEEGEPQAMKKRSVALYDCAVVVEKRSREKKGILKVNMMVVEQCKYC
ncbi:hypothetical protein HanRHA438_Chr09g0412361 [Helianthus annuus]|nr:hypothetical protein HanHA300_Chr09g0328741 [Helianthus annuus]KAJ0543339.1 hypothetical protein HanHA89_Chr09g0349631 [Helianthus annuus]KAJ0708397.1 hypothetical protein HanLR1_Chr09g0328981 [Helianthus annuus]KAJ0889391.1 hypothetical protein HanRHA438_Chr09g0412361 [Helianthus annuus]